MSKLQRLTVAAAVALFFFCAASRSWATDPSKQPAQSQPQKRQPVQSQPPKSPAAIIRPAPIQPSTALRQLQTISAQNPAGPSNTNSFRPNERIKDGASAGWDKQATDKGSVKISNNSKVDIGALNKQNQEEQRRIAQHYNAMNKPPPVPQSSKPPQQPASGVRGFFNKLFGKTN
jgi:hypothetical protein